MSRIEEITYAYIHCHGGWKCQCEGCPYNGNHEDCNNLEAYVGDILKSLAIVQGVDPRAFEKEDEDE